MQPILPPPPMPNGHHGKVYIGSRRPREHGEGSKWGFIYFLHNGELAKLPMIVKGMRVLRQAMLNLPEEDSEEERSYFRTIRTKTKG